MSYWGENNFRALAEISAELAADASLSDYVLCLRLRERGLRRQAFESLSRFLVSARQWPFDQRQRFADRILQIQYDHPDAHSLLPDPLWKNLIAPTLDDWAQQEPKNPIPFRWRGVFGKIEDLRHAVTLSPHEELARRILSIRLLRSVDYSIHELPNGFGYIGSPSEDLLLLDEVAHLLSELRDPRDPYDMPRAMQYLRSVVEAYIRYEMDGSDLSFIEWAHEHDLPIQHRWRHYPYDHS